MNGRCSTSDVQHQRNHRYDPTALQAELTWTRETVNAWMSAGECEVASMAVAALTNVGTGRPISAEEKNRHRKNSVLMRGLY